MYQSPEATPGVATDARAAPTPQNLFSLVKDKNGMTQLHWSSIHGEMKVARLIDHGADIHARTIGGETALHFAAMAGNLNAVRVLLDLGAEVSTKNNAGNTAHDLATHASHLQTAAVLQAAAERRAQRVAFAVVHQEWLGAGSWLEALAKKCCDT